MEPIFLYYLNTQEGILRDYLILDVIILCMLVIISLLILL